MAESRAFEDLLRSDPELLRSLVDQAADAVCLHEIDGRIIDVNRRMCTTLGYSREELLARSVLDLDVTATRDGTAKAAAQLAPGVPAIAERVLRRKDGSTFPIELSLSLISSGRRRLLLGIARDITDRKRVEATQEKALRDSEERFRELADRGCVLAWEADAATFEFTYVGPHASDLLGYPLADWYRPGFWLDQLHPEDRERTVEFCKQQSTTALDYEFEYRMIAVDGRVLWFQDIVHVIRDEQGPRTLRGFMIDITARRRAEDGRQLLLRELDHRVKNTLATVQAVAELTLRTSSSLADFGETFRERVASLARMHAAIWRNKGAEIRLRELAELSLAPFERDGETASIDGDEVMIPVETAGALGLVLHELATNAAKYGALSVTSGRVYVSWRLDAGRLSLTWLESGGPPVRQPSDSADSADSAHRGFGSILIEKSIPHELGGSVNLEFAPAGVRCAISFPLVRALPSG